MKITIVNCFDTYEERVSMLSNYFSKKGYQVKVVTSNFRHFKKTERIEKNEKYYLIDTIPYHKNLSLTRLYSHHKFSKKALEVVEQLAPDILYVLLPPNSLAKYASKYKKKHENTKLYFDILDLWPETMPIKKNMNSLPWSKWRKLRDNNFYNAEKIITECKLYNKVISNETTSNKIETLYLAKESQIKSENIIYNMNEIHLCYLGSINNIIDLNIIKKLCTEFSKRIPTTLHIIGDGEKREKLIEIVEETGTNVEYYGKIYDTNIRQNIFKKCHFGINIMKEDVFVGLTMKSIDYFEAGIPIINNIKGDTLEFVDTNNVGININNISKEVEEIMKLDLEDLNLMRKNSRELFESHFSKSSFEEKMDEIFEE